MRKAAEERLWCGVECGVLAVSAMAYDSSDAWSFAGTQEGTPSVRGGFSAALVVDPSRVWSAFWLSVGHLEVSETKHARTSNVSYGPVRDNSHAPATRNREQCAG